MSKSWKVTLATIIIAIVMTILPSFGIDSISEQQIEQLIFLALGISAVGAGNKVAKKIIKKKTEEEKTHREINYNGDGWFTVAEFKKSATHGNVVERGTQYLTISSDKVRSYMTVILRDAQNNLLVVDQKSAGTIPARIRLADKSGADLSPGNYSLQVNGDYGSSDSVGVIDRFSIT